MLAVTNIHTYYGQSCVLCGVSLGVGEGRVVALLGREREAGEARVGLDLLPRSGIHLLAQLGVGIDQIGRVFLDDGLQISRQRVPLRLVHHDHQSRRAERLIESDADLIDQELVLGALGGAGRA